MAASVVAVLILAAPAFAAEAGDGSAAFGSFSEAARAEQLRSRIAESLAIPMHTVEATVGGVVYHRVVSEALPEEDARQLIERAKALGFEAWYLAVAAPVEAPEPEPEEVAAEPAPTPTPTAEVADANPPEAQPSAEPEDDAAHTSATAEPSDETLEAEALTLAIEEPEEAEPEDAQAETPEPATEPAPPADDSAPIVATRMNDANIVIDGRVDEAAWQTAPAYDNMRVMEPETLAEPTYATRSRFIYTDEGLYVSAVMEQPAQTLVARLSSRDQYINRDSYGITLDTSGSGLYGYWFTVALGGSLADGKVAAERTITKQWDGAWRGESAITDDGWSVEMFLPWSMMSMPQIDSERVLGFWVDRKVAHMDERYSWPVLPFTAPRFMSALKPMAVADVRPAKQWAVFPYSSAAADGIQDETHAKVGVDVAWRPTTNMQLTATVNPDFGAVESDDVVVNLTAFETYFPEKRLFFLEGNEVFFTSPRANPQSSSSGPQGQGARRSPQTFFREPTTLLNTRRIGGAARHVEIPDDIDIAGVERSKPTDLLGAAKLVGQAGGVRYGVLSAFEDEVRLHGTHTDTDEDVIFHADGRDFGAARILYEQTTDGGRRGIGYMGTMVDKSYDTAIVHGIDTHWLGANGRVEWDTQFLSSEVDDERGYGVYTDVSYTPRIGAFNRCSMEYLDENLDVGDFGFIRRTDAISAVCGTFRYFAGDALPDRLRNIRASLFASYEQNTDGLATRVGFFVGTGFTFQDNSQLRLMANYFPKRWDDLNSRGNGAFRIEDRIFAQAQYGTDSAKPFAVSVALGVDGEEMGGTTLLFDTGFTYTPFHRFSVDFDLRYKDRDGWLVYGGDGQFTTYRTFDLQPRMAVDLFLTARQQIRLTMQWAGIKADQRHFYEIPEGGGKLITRETPLTSEDFAISRLVAQLRYRWEIGPLSDLFVVYTRGGNLPERVDEGFSDLFLDALAEPVVDVFIVKLRYRFGS